MAHITSSVEYAIHCLLFLVSSGDAALSSRDLADLQGISPSFLAKIFPKLEKAGLVAASEGVRGGYKLGKPADKISFLDIITAIEGDKPLFDCQNIRGSCAVFGGKPPAWSLAGVCAVHAVMLRAEKSMRDVLAKETLADVATTFGRKAPAEFGSAVHQWITARMNTRTAARASPRKRTRAAPA